MTDQTYFLDSNVLMYCFGSDHPMKGPCKKLIDLIGRGEIVVVTDTEVLQEILHRFFSIKKQGLALELYQATVAICRTVLPVTLADTDMAKDILLKNANINVRDAIHAALMFNNGLENILSADRHFDDIEGIDRVDPLKFPFPG